MTGDGRRFGGVDNAMLDAAVTACRSLIATRFPDLSEHGAAAMVLRDGTIVTGTSPRVDNNSVALCHETEPYCAAFRLGQPVAASVCLHRNPDRRLVVLSPCGLCRERLSVYGPEVLAAVPLVDDPTQVVWKQLRDLLPDAWMTAFPQELPAWAER
jgi:cytidine deaminase